MFCNKNDVVYEDGCIDELHWKVCDVQRLKNLEGYKLLPAAPGPGSEVPFGTCPLETELF